MIIEKTDSKQVDLPLPRGRFQPGQSGNPAGRPKGARNRTTIAAQLLLDGEAEALTRKTIQLALEGDATALRLCMERVVPPRKDRPISIELPPILTAEDARVAGAVVLMAVAEGRITPSEAVIVSGLIEAQRRTLPQTPADVSNPMIQVNFVQPNEE